MLCTAVSAVQQQESEHVVQCCVSDAVRGGQVCCLTTALRRRQMRVADYDPDSRQLHFTALHWACYWGRTEVSARSQTVIGASAVTVSASVQR